MTFLIESRCYGEMSRERLGRKRGNNASRISATLNQALKVGHARLLEVIVPKSVEDDENQQRFVPGVAYLVFAFKYILTARDRT